MPTSVLLIDPDPRRAAPVEAALKGAGHEVTLAPSGGFALTMLERSRPDVILSRFQIDDMYAYELCAIVRSDPHTEGIPFILLSDNAPGDAESITRAVTGATQGDATAPTPVPEAGPTGPVAAGEAPGPRGPRVLRPPAQPALEGREMPAMVRAVCDGRKTGRLRARLGAVEGALVFEGGRLVHAEFQGQEGKRAVTSLVAAAVATPGASFHFVPWDGAEVSKRGRTVDEGGQHLLMLACAAMDSTRTADGGPSRDAAPPLGEDA
jgi:CheY-like chemotaxis protein